MSDVPVGVFGSGVGGLAAAPATPDRLPPEAPLVIGDSAFIRDSVHAPPFAERQIAVPRPLVGCIESYLTAPREADIATVILSGTHYPLRTAVIGLVTGERVTSVSSARFRGRDIDPVGAAPAAIR